VGKTAGGRRSSADSRESAVRNRQPAAGSPQSPREIAESLARRVVIERIQPEIDGGRFPIKRTPGEVVDVSATIFADGHDVITAVLRDCPRLTVEHAEKNSFSEISAIKREQLAKKAENNAFSAGSANSAVKRDQWRETPMILESPGTDRWTARFDAGPVGWHEYQIVAWVDRFLTWRRDVKVKAAAGQDVSLELLEGSMLVRDAADRASEEDAASLLEQADALSDSTPQDDRVRMALGDELASLMSAYADRGRATESEPDRIWVDRERARFGAWYEMFPRSAGPASDRSGTFQEARASLRRIAELGFDVVYLPPIHPIGTSYRKGRNNALVAGPTDPGSPWAIGSKAGGHTAVDPGLGTLDDFDAFRADAERLGLEVALDLAWQCSPDHPWVRQHPEWFRHRPDGTIKYAENPPKKYQDIYPFDFECDEWRALWQALLDVTMFWIDHGVQIFRVDNPHTKTLRFWEWMIGQVHERHPGVLFLSEAFTRPPIMRWLAKAGFTQSYTYFTWRNTKLELVDYFTDLTTTESREYLRPNLFTNTPDILHEYLQHGGRAAFEARLLLAATLGANYGIYSGFELCEGQAIPGTEEYADSEKYQFRKWDWKRPGHIEELVCQVNKIRHAHRALQFDHTLAFHATDNPEIIAYSKWAPDRSERLLVVVNLDPLHMQHGHVEVPDVHGDHRYAVRDLIDDVCYEWRGAWNYVRFDPDIRQGHILCLPTPRP
jgi:starch synthase (maltosyl-transferring)